jgi:hypothetical protein
MLGTVLLPTDSLYRWGHHSSPTPYFCSTFPLPITSNPVQLSSAYPRLQNATAVLCPGYCITIFGKWRAIRSQVASPLLKKLALFVELSDLLASKRALTSAASLLPKLERRRRETSKNRHHQPHETRSTDWPWDIL